MDAAADAPPEDVPQASLAPMVEFRSEASDPRTRLEEASAAGDPWAQCYLGRLHWSFSMDGVPLSCPREESINDKISRSSAFHYGKLFATRAAGSHHYSDFVQLLGAGIEGPDISEAHRLLDAAARAGAPDAWFVLGQAYSMGDGVPRDPDRAVDCFESGLAAGSEEACAALAYELMHHADLAQRRRGLDCAERAFAARIPRAAVYLAHYHKRNLAEISEVRSGLAIIEEGVANGCTLSMVTLAMDGLGGTEHDWFSSPPEPRERKRLLKMALDQGDPMAGQLLFDGNKEGLIGSPSAPLMRQTARRLMDLGSPLGYQRMGIYLLEGIGSGPDPGAAVAHFERAWQLGNAMGSINFANLLRKGTGGHYRPDIAHQVLSSILDGSYYVASENGVVLDYAQDILAQIQVSFYQDSGQQKACTYCNGNGHVPRVGNPLTSQTAGYASFQMQCPSCYGSGKQR